MGVKFLRRELIEHSANRLLRQFMLESGEIRGPVPVEEIVMFLGLSLDYENLSQKFGIEGEVLGCINVDTKEIFIEESLLPEENPSAGEGRYRFTVGHETGHWILHRNLVRESYKANLLESNSTFVCQTSLTKPRIEWQADYFSTCLLMPRSWVFQAIGQKNFQYLTPGEIIYHIAKSFEVSKQAARIRLEELGVIEDSRRAAMAS